MDERLAAAPDIIRRAMSLVPSQGQPAITGKSINGLTYMITGNPEGRIFLRISSGTPPALVFAAHWDHPAGPYQVETFDRGDWEASLPSHV